MKKKNQEMDSIRFKVPKVLKIKFQKYCIDSDSDMSKTLNEYLVNYVSISKFLEENSREISSY